MDTRRAAPLIKSTVSYKGSHIAIGIVIALLSWLSYTFIQNAFSFKYLQLSDLIAAVCMLGIAVYLAHAIFIVDVLLIYPERLVVKSGLGYVKKVILLPQVTMYTDEQKEGKFGSYTYLTIYTPNTSYGVSSHLYSNYNAVREALTKYGKRDYAKLTDGYKRRKLASTALLTIAAVGCLYITYYYRLHSADSRYINPAELVLIEDRLTNTPEIGRHKSSRWISISLKNYPQFDFEISDAYKVTAATEYVDNVKLGNKISVGIKSSDYHKKIAEDVPLTFWEKHNNYAYIPVYSLNHGGIQYLNVRDYNSYLSDNPPSNSAWMVLVLAAFIIYCAWQEAKEYLRY